MQSEKNNSILKSKLLYTFLILLVYLLGKGLPLYMIDLDAYMHREVNAEALLVQTISGDIYQCSLFALGISPYMISSIVVQVLNVFRSSEARKHTSPKTKNKWVLAVTLVVAVIMAFVRVQDLQFETSGGLLPFVQFVAGMEMVAGSFMILYLASRNQKYGIGGQSALIFVNILDGIIVTLQGHEWRQLGLPLVISLVAMFVMIIMENAEKRIPVQRISIHNIYADRNYLAIKLNPIGIMPVMFATAFFMLPQLLLSLLGMFFPENADILWLQDNMNLSSPVGIGVYAATLCSLTVGFSRVMINPKELTEQFLKSGDSIRDLHAGRDTKKYLSGVITRLSLFSAAVMSVCLCVPMVLQLTGELESSFTTLPSSVMMLTGMWCNLYREAQAVRDLEAYKPFI